MFQTKLIKTADELLLISEKWNDLLKKQLVSTPFHTITWLMTCLEALKDQIVIGVIESNDRFYAAVAASTYKGEGGAFLKSVKVLSFEPKIGTVRPGSLVAMIDPDVHGLPLNEIIEKIFKYLKWDVIFFQYWNNDIEWLKEPVRTYFAKNKLIAAEGFSSVEAWISTKLSVVDYHKSRSTKLKKNLRNAQNRIIKTGEMTFCDLCETKKEWREIEEVIIDLYRKSWQFDSKDSPLDKSVRKHVLRSCRRFYEQGRFSVFVLYIDSTPVSFLASFIHNSILYPMAIGYKRDFENLSVGGLLIQNSYGFYKNKGIKGVYFGPVREESRTGYKKKWATDIIYVPNLFIIKPWSFYGFLHLFFNKSSLFRKIYWLTFKANN